MASFVKITSYPPLRQLTIVPSLCSSVNFTVIVEACLIFPPLPWEIIVSIRNDGCSTGKEIQLAPSNKPLQCLERPPATVDTFKSRYHHAYTGVIDLGASDVQLSTFRIRYRLDSWSPWSWVEDQAGISFGEILVQKPLPGNKVALSHYLNLQPGWNFSNSYCEATTSSIIVFELPIEGATPTSDDFTTVTKILGRVIAQKRYFALGQVTEPWIAPRHGASEFDLQEDGILCCFLNSDGQSIVLLGLSGLGATQVAIKSTDSYEISIMAKNNSPTPSVAKVIAAISNDVESSIEAVMNSAREVFAKVTDSHLFSERGLKQIPRQNSDLRAPDHDLNDWYDGLTYCTWNSLGWDLNPGKIANGLTSLLKSGIQVSTLIIDDNWQTIDNSDNLVPRMHRAMERFEANSSFADGFAAGIAYIRKQHPYIGDIAVWHALLGYWGGISPRGQLAKDYKTTTLHAQYWRHVKKDMCTIDPDDIHRFYDDFYRFLASCGITAVKTDVQFMEGEFTSGIARARFLDSYPSAWTAAHLTHLKGRAISCMSLIPQNLFRSFLRQDLPKVLLRNSDDFFPEVPISHPLHLFNNAHNALLTSHLNVVCDWDMFQTSHPYSAFHAAGRCLSGGPISITDVPGEHDMDLIQQMTAVSPAGKTIALRPTTGGKAITCWDRFSARNLLKIGALCGSEEKTGTSILGLFNMDDKEHTALVTLSDFPSWKTGRRANEPEGQAILVRTHRDDRFFSPLTRGASSLDQLLYTVIDARSFDMVYSHAIHEVPFNSHNLSFALLGLLNKMTGPAAIVTWGIELTNRKVELRIELKALGILGIWLSRENWSSDFESPMITINGQMSHEPIALRDVENAGTVLEVDVLAIWTAMQTTTCSRTVELVITWE